MSNLGAYQALTTKAAQMGGVEVMLAAVERSAVIRSAPKLVGAGALLGAAGVYGIKLTAGAAPKIQAWWEKRHHDDLRAGATAKQELIELLDEEPPANQDINIAED